MIPALDEVIGGLAEGAMTVFTGKPGNGKSTLAGQLLLNAIEQGHSVCAYSGELTKEKFQEWINLQAAGSEYIGLKYDPVRDIRVPCVPYAVQERLLDYYRDRFYLTFNVPNTLCNSCGYISKHQLDTCPKCGSRDLDYATRIIGYLKLISRFAHDRQIEAGKRHYSHGLEEYHESEAEF